MTLLFSHIIRFAAEFTQGCSVWAWLSNSIVTHSVSDTPEGPYTKSDCAMETCEPEAHEPSVARAPTGEWVMWFTSSKEGPGGVTPGAANAGFKHCDCTSNASLYETCRFQCPPVTGCRPTHSPLAARRSPPAAHRYFRLPAAQVPGCWVEPHCRHAHAHELGCVAARAVVQTCHHCHA